MSVDLATLIPSVRRETSPPGTDLFPDSEDVDWLGQLEDSFWEAKLFGFFEAYTADVNGIVNPIVAGSPDVERDDQQLIVLFAGIRAVRMRLMNTNTLFKAVAGPVSFEVANSANLLVEILKELQSKITIIYKDLSGLLGQTQVYYMNAVLERESSIMFGDERVYGSGGSQGAGGFGWSGSQSW